MASHDANWYKVQRNKLWHSASIALSEKLIRDNAKGVMLWGDLRKTSHIFRTAYLIFGVFLCTIWVWKVLYRKYLIGYIQMLWLSLCRNDLSSWNTVQYSTSHHITSHLFFTEIIGCFPQYLKSKLFRQCFEHGNDNFSKNTNRKIMLHCYKILLFGSFYFSKNFKKQYYQHFHINQQNSILGEFHHVTLKTGGMMLKIQLYSQE